MDYNWQLLFAQRLRQGFVELLLNVLECLYYVLDDQGRYITFMAQIQFHLHVYYYMLHHIVNLDNV